MKTQISRDSFLAAKRYSGVYQQQGRMITDADWNELSDLAKQRLQDALLNAIGSGAPRDDSHAGLALGWTMDSNKNLMLWPGVLYVDGIAARLAGTAGIPVPYNSQPDFPKPPALPTNCLLYADVWERPVTWLEDQDLLDPGLHGADTCTRTQTMLQVKWCDPGKNPEDSSQNPRQGDALLALAVRKIVAQQDQCDPCAAEAATIDDKGTNYLFRVEVHDYHNGILTLKWSSDNGAEQCRVAQASDEFKQADYVFEFFNNETEKNLGVHLPSQPERGRLQWDGYVEPDDQDEGRTKWPYVRQWDGYCKLNLSTTPPQLVIDGPNTAGTDTGGTDRGVPLSTSLGSDAHGAVTVNATTVTVNLELLTLQLAYKNHQFVAGDYWLAPVRRDVHGPGAPVLGTITSNGGVAPHGIAHHYLTLAQVIGGVIQPQTDSQRRRFSFPPLTDIRAEDVGYAPPACGNNEVPTVRTLLGIDPGTKTVGDILDALLCNLQAASLPYRVQTCGSTPTVRSLLGIAPQSPQTAGDILDDLLCNLDAAKLPYDVGSCNTSAQPTIQSLLGILAVRTTVADVLRKLLCSVRATHIPLDGSVPGQCPELSQWKNVQSALNGLCESVEESTHVLSVQVRDSASRPIRLHNRDEISTDKLVRGLDIVTSTPIDPALLWDAACSVSVEIPFPSDESEVDSWGLRRIGYRTIKLAGTLSAVSNRCVRWLPQPGTADWVSHRLCEQGVASWYSHPLYVSSIVPGQLAYLGTVSISPQYVRYGATGIELTATAKYNTPLGLVFNWRNERDFWVAMAYNVNSPDSGAAAILRVYHMKNEQSVLDFTATGAPLPVPFAIQVTQSPGGLLITAGPGTLARSGQTSGLDPGPSPRPSSGQTSGVGPGPQAPPSSSQVNQVSLSIPAAFDGQIYPQTQVGMVTRFDGLCKVMDLRIAYPTGEEVIFPDTGPQLDPVRGNRVLAHLCLRRGLLQATRDGLDRVGGPATELGRRDADFELWFWLAPELYGYAAAMSPGRIVVGEEGAL